VHDIILIKEQTACVKADDDLSSFVSNAENALSRKHTPWVTCKDM
jgi:hypothetical protein